MRPSIQRLSELLNYDADTGAFHWKASGRLAGTTNHHGYRFIGIDNRALAAHRIAWAMSNGEWPSGPVDHRNRVRDDNRLANLRLASAPENGANSTHPLGVSGVRGVSRHKASGKWRAQIKVVGKKLHLGVFDDVDAAAEAYRAAAIKHHGEFARFE